MTTDSSKSTSTVTEKNSERSSSREELDEYSHLYKMPSNPLLRLMYRMFGWWRHLEVGGQALTAFDSFRKRALKIFRFRGSDYVTEEDSEFVVRTWPSKTTLANPIWWIRWSFGFSWRWFISRPYGPMLLALPACVAFSALAALGFRGSRISKGTQMAIYRQMVADSSASEKHERTRLLADALVRLDPGSERTGLIKAMFEAEIGESKVAKNLMQDLASNQKSAKAAMWLVEQERNTDQVFDEWSVEKKRQYYDLLMQAIRLAPENPKPRRLLADVMRSIGQAEKAYQIMLPIAGSSIENACIVAYLENELGYAEKAKARATELEAAFRSHLLEKPSDLASRTQHSMLLLLLERPADAVDVLQAGLALTDQEDESVVLKKAITEAMVVLAEKIRTEDNSARGFMRAMEKLQEAMAFDPTNSNLLKAVTSACIRASRSKNKELLILREAVIQGVATEASHFILGTTLLMQGKVEDAKQHLEIAQLNNPNLPGLLNNLAYGILMEENPDLDRALRLSNAAVRALPENTYVRETRGQIYLNRKEFAKAIADFEFALSSPELHQIVRPKLIAAYTASGDHAFAERHRQLLKKGK